MSRMNEIIATSRERALLVGLTLPGRTPADTEESLAELAQLTDAAGSEVIGRVTQARQSPDPATCVGKGKANEIRERIAADQINVVVFDEDLSPAQAKNLQELLSVRVIDRTWVILDIFARRARTKQAKLQVQIAQLRYKLPHLAQQWQHLEQEDGGVGRRGGAGEQQIETDRRMARKRIANLAEELEKLQLRAGVEAAQRRTTYRVALVGYTNSGKSTLFNRLTATHEVVERDQLFTTLDTTVRKMPSSSGEIVLSDTVGFINKLPEHLLDAFHTTLGEAMEAELLLHVIDATAARMEERITVVNDVLERLNIDPAKVIKIFNKTDALTDRTHLERIKRTYPGAHCISALEGGGVNDLQGFIETSLTSGHGTMKLRCAYRDSGLLTEVYRIGEVLDRRDLADGAVVTVRARPEQLEKLKRLGLKEVIKTAKVKINSKNQITNTK
jgi:GTP-binding protein HflX